MDENKIKISVIVPVYNLEDKIERCIESLINQTLKDIEIIVIDDGSTDKSLEKIQRFKEKNIKTITQKNSGASFSRNQGINLARGEYITFLDGDDWIEKNAYEVMYKYAKSESLDCLICDYKEESSENQLICNDYFIKEKYRLIDKNDYLKKLFSWNGVAPAVWNKLIKRDIYRKSLVRFPENIFLGEDFSLTSRILIRCEKIGKLSESFVHYVQHLNQGTKKRKENQILDLFIAHDIVKQDYESQNIYEEYKELLEISKIKLIYKDFFKLNLVIKNEKEREAIERFCSDFKEIKKSKEYKKIVLNRRIRCELKYYKYLWRINVRKIFYK